MNPVFRKLNLKNQTQILVLSAPSSFEPELASLRGVTVAREIAQTQSVDFALAFVTNQAALESVVPAIVERAVGDAVLWFAYPKLSSKKYHSDLNRDEGWAVLAAAGFRPVRQVAIDADWSAVRFRRVEFVKPASSRA